MHQGSYSAPGLDQSSARKARHLTVSELRHRSVEQIIDPDHGGVNVDVARWQVAGAPHDTLIRSTGVALTAAARHVDSPEQLLFWRQKLLAPTARYLRCSTHGLWRGHSTRHPSSALRPESVIRTRVTLIFRLPTLMVSWCSVASPSRIRSASIFGLSALPW